MENQLVVQEEQRELKTVLNFDISYYRAFNLIETLKSRVNYTDFFYSILYNKRNSALEIYIDDNNKNILNNANSKVIVHRDLQKCIFSNLFFDYKDFNDDKTDFHGKFIKVKEGREQYVKSFFYEIKHFKRTASTDDIKSPTNYLTVSGWICPECKNDIVVYFIERRTYNPNTNKSILRSLSLQFSTKNGYNYLKKLNDETVYMM